MILNNVSYGPTDKCEGYDNWQESLLNGESLADDIQSRGWDKTEPDDLLALYDETARYFRPENPEDCRLLLEVCIKGMQMYSNYPEPLDERLESRLDDEPDAPIKALIAEELATLAEDRFGLQHDDNSDGTDVCSANYDYGVSFRDNYYRINIEVSVI